MVPVAIRVPPEEVHQRTIPIVVTVDDGSRSVDVATTFKTPGESQ